jgi:NhaP-type Na+/H+ or K+/H+ antiporter
MKLTHFQALLLFALLVSAAFGVLSRKDWKEQVKYALWCLFLFLLVGVAIGWAMYPISR